MNNLDSTMMDVKQIQHKMQAYFQTHWKLFLAEGILLIILGVIAIMAPHFFTVAIVVSIGWILLFSGIFIICRALFFSQMPGFGLWLFMALRKLSLVICF